MAPRLTWLLALVCVAAALVALAADGGRLAEVHLKNGVRLRGTVTETAEEIVLTNAAGETRIPRAEVERIVPVEEVATQPATAPIIEEEEEPNAVTEPPAYELLLPPPISKEDIQRLRLHELALRPVEMLRVQFERRGRQRELGLEVLDELRKRSDFRPQWEDVLTRGQPYEKLNLIVRETGLKHADRIRIQSDPAAFDVYRRRVLPIVTSSCARSGCHGGVAARVFRFPAGSKTGESFAYTSFVLLDQMFDAGGRVIDREDPEQSGLLRYLLSPDVVENGHPPVGRGPAFKPALRGREDPQYGMLADWIRSLRKPHPDYGLEYQNPYAGRVAAIPLEQRSAPATQPVATQPAPPSPETAPAPPAPDED